MARWSWLVTGSAAVFAAMLAAPAPMPPTAGLNSVPGISTRGANMIDAANTARLNVLAAWSVGA